MPLLSLDAQSRPRAELERILNVSEAAKALGVSASHQQAPDPAGEPEPGRILMAHIIS